MFLRLRYRDAADLQAGGGYQDVAALIHRVGVPLEVVCIVNDRVLMVEAFDYEEGCEYPLTCEERYWWDVLEMPAIEPVLVKSAVFAVHPDGRWIQAGRGRLTWARGRLGPAPQEGIDKG